MTLNVEVPLMTVDQASYLREKVRSVHAVACWWESGCFRRADGIEAIREALHSLSTSLIICWYVPYDTHTYALTPGSEAWEAARVSMLTQRQRAAEMV